MCKLASLFCIPVWNKNEEENNPKCSLTVLRTISIFLLQFGTSYKYAPELTGDVTK
jgi:hypothetical protein